MYRDRLKEQSSGFKNLKKEIEDAQNGQQTKKSHIFADFENSHLDFCARGEIFFFVC